MTERAAHGITRRDLITAGLASTLLGAVGVRAEVPPKIFDSHVHVTASDSVRYPTNPLSGTIRPEELKDPLTVERLLASMNQIGIDHAVLTQRLHIYSFDNTYVLDCVQAYPDRFMAVCGVDGRDPKAGETTRQLLKNRNVRAVRLTEPSRGSDLSWLSGKEATGVWQAAADLGGVLVLHFYVWNRSECLAAIQPLVKRYSSLPIVIDHGSNLAVAEGAPNFGIDAALSTVANSSNVYFKISTINLNAIEKAGLTAKPVLERVVAEVGPGRIMWGSDVGNTPGDLLEMTNRIKLVVATMPTSVQSAILHETAQTIFSPLGKVHS